MKWVVALVFIVNSVALYFMLTYGIEIDRTMVGNILNTDRRETAELLHLSLVPYVLLLGIVPAVLVLKVKARGGRPESGALPLRVGQLAYWRHGLHSPLSRCFGVTAMHRAWAVKFCHDPIS